MSTNQEFSCIFCNAVFENKDEFQEHFRKHGDPMYKNRFEIDTQVHDEKSKEKAEMVSCDVCAQVFPTISKAITHKHKVHPDHDAKYFCPWCGKLFTMKHLYNVHVHSNHNDQEITEDKSFRCDSCGVDFFIPSAMMNHNKFFHRQDSDIPDVGQSKKFKLYNQEVIHIYYCAFCGEEYENKVNLFKHMTDDHGDENQSPDEVLKCPLCEAIFYHLDAYEIHLTFHSPEDMFTVKNTEYGDLLDYSLESVPPIIEKVENLEGQTEDVDADAESTINAVGIEKFLELAMDHSDDSNPVKVKKHKKHKKSKKSAITLDEFLSMNQDVFGEGLDFQGIEEVPTRVVKKQLKNSKKAINAVTSAELDKLKKAGIVIKKKVCRNPVVKNLKVTSSTKSLQNKFNGINPEQGIKTSSEVLSKLMNQSNNQIKIVRKVSPDNAIKEPKLKSKDVSVQESQTPRENICVNVTDTDHKNDQTKRIPVNKSESSLCEDIINDVSSLKTKEVLDQENPLSNKLDKCDSNADDVNQLTKDSFPNNVNLQGISKDSDVNYSSKPENNKNYESKSKKQSNSDDKEIEKNKLDQYYSDPEFGARENETKDINLERKNEIPEISHKNNNQHNTNTSTIGTLSTLKHLSHLITVKPVSQNKNITSIEPTICKISENKDENSHSDTPHLVSSTITANLTKAKIVDNDPTLGAIKNLSKNITIKSLSTKRNIDESKTEDDTEIKDAEKTNNLKLKDVSGNKNLTIKKIKVEVDESQLNHKNMNSSKSEEQLSQKAAIISKPAVMMKPTKIIDNSTQISNANILKRLTNITTKPIIKNTNILPPVEKVNISDKINETEDKNEEIIEIFDIDDSEDENESNSNQPESSPNAVKHIDALKNLNKNVTVKSLNHQLAQQNVKLESNIKVEKQHEDNYSNYKDDSNVDALIKKQNRNMAFKNMLQGLSKNITIKSRNSSPSQSVKSQDHTEIQDYNILKLMEDNESSGSDSCSGNIKITEIDEQENGNDDIFEKLQKLKTSHDEPIIEPPSQNVNSDNKEINEKADFKAEIKLSTVVKCNENSTVNSMCLDNLKHISKNITIKSLSKSSTDKEDKFKPTLIHGNSDNQMKYLPIKSAKQIKDPVNESMSSNINSKKVGYIVDHTLSQSSNPKISAINQTNTINKEVTVKTIQTKTVIQEITTTVTKTVKTVNQTMKQEVRNTVQTNTAMVKQGVKGMGSTQAKNLKGVVIRHAAPNIPKTSITVPQIRPAGTVVRPSKQVVPVKGIQGVNVTQPNNTRMATGTKLMSLPNPNKQVIGKPLKISPTAMSSTIIKRPNTEDVRGPFSCFKKPKESLIPVSDIPTFGNCGSEATTQFTSASYTNSSNFACTAKTIKGNSIATAKLMKSEISATNHQLNRVSTTTGLKIISSQAKQTQVQEKSETSAMKRTTLEAIQRLQKQGLLVKKPRVDINEGGDCDQDVDDNVGHCSAGESDE